MPVRGVLVLISLHLTAYLLRLDRSFPSASNDRSLGSEDFSQFPHYCTLSHIGNEPIFIKYGMFNWTKNCFDSSGACECRDYHVLSVTTRL